MLDRTLSRMGDYLVYAADGRLMMVVEAKVGGAAERSWAMQTRRNLLAHAGLAQVGYLLLAHPKRFYLWRNPSGESEPEWMEPTDEVDPFPFLRSYYEKSGLSPDTITAASFEFLIYGWLNELAIFGIRSALPAPQQQFLEASGLLQLLAQADIVGNYVA